MERKLFLLRKVATGKEQVKVGVDWNWNWNVGAKEGQADETREREGERQETESRALNYRAQCPGRGFVSLPPVCPLSVATPMPCRAIHANANQSITHID